MITCHSCGEPLAEALDAENLTIAGKEIRFRRTSDYVACPECGAMRSVESLRKEAIAEGDLDVDDVMAGRSDPEGHDVVREALDEMRAVADEREDVEHEDVDAALELLSDLSQDDDPSVSEGDETDETSDDREGREPPPD